MGFESGLLQKSEYRGPGRYHRALLHVTLGDNAGVGCPKSALIHIEGRAVPACPAGHPRLGQRLLTQSRGVKFLLRGEASVEQVFETLSFSLASSRSALMRCNSASASRSWASLRSVSRVAIVLPAAISMPSRAGTLTNVPLTSRPIGCHAPLLPCHIAGPSLVLV